MPYSSTKTDIVNVTVTSGGTEMPLGYGLLSVDVIQDINRISYASLTLTDGDFASKEYRISDSDFFDPGNSITITINYSGESSGKRAVFTGIIIKYSLKKTISGCILSVDISDAAVKMTTQRKSSIFNKITDSDLIGTLIGSYKGVSAGAITTTAAIHERIVQYYTSDWDMLLSRAEVNGLLVAAVNGVVSAVKPSFGAAAMSFEIGKDTVYDFDLQADARHQYAAVTTRTWDLDTQQISELTSDTRFTLKQGVLKSSNLAAAMGNSDDRMVSVIPVNAQEASAWADARMVKTRLSMLKGSFSVAGVGGLKLGDNIELKGAGNKFSGENIVTGLKHHISGGNWVTTIQFGLSADWFSSAVKLTDTKAAGLLPGINGLQVGIVETSNGDPENQSRVKVRMPAMDNNENAIWARLTTLDGGYNRGIFFWPEPGDEVILGFINDDPRNPVILGSVYGPKNQPVVAQTEANGQKGIVTKSGMKLLFDDENKTLRIQTSDNNKILIDEDSKQIEMNDANGNSLTLSNAGIVMKSAKNVMIKAQGDIDIQGKGIKIKGSTIDLI
ncbi:type VI secretion system tip protein VgrG [Mucilaginibacter phyllosphaerae]|uniref:Rhs element Vgr protein n=1 Tax=Mucilaginibacter phyllosphaerae TaxID=1812349 RepID=A0A4Y8ABY2_9SPHI|nr:type VI secretion system tip protein VgrG [Mucilaginibacter phyllosphaerae]MBB3969166.1 Rhs element Vgr protein [Mucilaginibacter phyllosphaerae]TEW66025.1 type VI secretion system tip protein VgrG [Mucilaginibacter phyllosphaerae]GGH06745.1 hypothetical protein GCM10007352_11090 [Mucilaginibacter phyllosphaerae]